jgi:hypothetical protein
MREWAEEMLEDEPEALFMDGLDEAIIGVTVGQAGQERLVVYDEDLIIKTLVEDMDGEEEDAEASAWEHYGFNVQGSYVGPHTPIIIKRPSPMDRPAPGETTELE